MTEKNNDRSGELTDANRARKNRANDGWAAQELKAQNIVSMMTESGKIRDIKNRRLLAENLGRILDKRKQHLNLSELVVSAGVSENPDPSRLGRFRILPGKSANQAAIKRLSQDPLAYIQIVQEAAKMTDENPAVLIEELVLSTRYDVSGLEGVGIEPFAQLLTLIQKKIDALNAKFDLENYFKTLQNYDLLPVWSRGLSCNGKIASHNSAERSEIIKWEKRQQTYPRQNDIWRYQVMPCVPLCRLRRKNIDPIKATVRIGEYHGDATLKLFTRLYLAIGMFDHHDWSMNEIEDMSPCPYLITVDEFHYFFPWDDSNFLTKEESGVVTGGVNTDELPFFFYDKDTHLKIEKIEGYYEMLYSPEGVASEEPLRLDAIEAVYPINLTLLRNIFGKPLGHNNMLTSNDDVLNAHKLGMTLAPHNTIAAMMEINLLEPSTEGTENERKIVPNFLDILEHDTERMTTSLHNWLQDIRITLEAKHRTLLDIYEGEIQNEKNKKGMTFKKNDPITAEDRDTK